jgi:type II secretory pathway component PulM
VNDFLHGALTTASFAIGLFFLRYWRSTRDRLFLLFSAAFWLLALNWMLATMAPSLATHAHSLRFLAFVLIALAVLDKNRRKKS